MTHTFGVIIKRSTRLNNVGASNYAMVSKTSKQTYRIYTKPPPPPGLKVSAPTNNK